MTTSQKEEKVLQLIHINNNSTLTNKKHEYNACINMN